MSQQPCLVCTMHLEEFTPDQVFVQAYLMALAGPCFHDISARTVLKMFTETACDEHKELIAMNLKAHGDMTSAILRGLS